MEGSNLEEQALEYGISVNNQSSSALISSKDSQLYGAKFELELTSSLVGDEQETWFNKTHLKINYRTPDCPISQEFVTNNLTTNATFKPIYLEAYFNDTTVKFSITEILEQAKSAFNITSDVNYCGGVDYGLVFSDSTITNLIQFERNEQSINLVLSQTAIPGAYEGISLRIFYKLAPEWAQLDIPISVQIFETQESQESQEEKPDLQDNLDLDVDKSKFEEIDTIAKEDQKDSSTS